MATKNTPEPELNTKLLRRALIAVLCAALLFVAYFGFSAAASFVYWNDERHQFQPIAGWMTPRYVAKSWQVRPEIVANALQLKLNDGTGRQSLEQLAETQGVDVGALIAALDAAIVAEQTARE